MPRPFAAWGKGLLIEFDELWQQRVTQDAVLWSEYGCPFDLRSVLPVREYRAHLAILKGKGEKMDEERRKAERKAGRRR